MSTATTPFSSTTPFLLGGAEASRFDLAGILRNLPENGHPRWHSDFAWQHYRQIVLNAAYAVGGKRVCEIGGGRDPLFLPQEAKAAAIELIVNDIDADELAAGPEGFEHACFDIAGDLDAAGIEPAQFDVMTSRMVIEHVGDVRRAWANMHAMLRPGGIAMAFFPTLYAWPYLVNLMIPEVVSRRIVETLFPGRRSGGDDPKFPAYYDWCYGNPRKMAPMLHEAGFESVHVQPYWGHGYLKSVPGLREIDNGLNRLLAKTQTTTFSTYALVMARKSRG